MNEEYRQPHAEEADVQRLARPFLTGLLPAVAPEAPRHLRLGSHDDGPAEEADVVRPYYVTGGRVHDGLGDFGTVYMLTPTGETRVGDLAFERRQIAELCRSAQSVAEISALLSLPLGVATVLTRDLAAAGFLAAATSAPDPTTDLTIITRLINAVHAL